jgi:uncharacterized protein (DUF1778 family)
MPPKKTRRLTFRVTPEALRQIADAAKKEGRSKSNFLHQLIIKALNDHEQARQNKEAAA